MNNQLFAILAVSILLVACIDENGLTSTGSNSSSSSLSQSELSSGKQSSPSSAGGTSTTTDNSSSSAPAGDFDTLINPYAGIYRTSFEPGGDCSDDFEFEDIIIETQTYTATHHYDGCEEYTFSTEVYLLNGRFVMTNGSVTYTECGQGNDRGINDSTLEIFQSDQGYRFLDAQGTSILSCRKDPS